MIKSLFKKIAASFGSRVTGLGLILGLWIAGVVYHDYTKVAHLTRVPGRVVFDWRRHKIEYAIPGIDGVFHVIPKLRTFLTHYDLNETVYVFADPENPSNARIDSITERWFVPLVLSVFFFVFSFIGFICSLAIYPVRQI